MKVKWDKKHSEALDLCFAVYFKSPSAYNVLRQSGFVLPCARTLREKYKFVLDNVGLCPKLLQMLKVRANVLSDVERHVTIAFDGMSLKPGLKFNKSADIITGFENLGKFGCSNHVAHEAVVVMVRGLTLRWKQVL